MVLNVKNNDHLTIVFELAVLATEKEDGGHQHEHEHDHDHGHDHDHDDHGDGHSSGVDLTTLELQDDRLEEFLKLEAK